MKEEFIKNTPLFGELTEEEQRAIGKRMRLEEYNPNETLFTKGGESEALYLIKEGWVKLSDGDQAAVIATLGPGSLLGDTDFFLGNPYNLTARASGKVTVWSLDQAAMTGLIAEHPEIGLYLGLAFGRGIAQFQQQLIDRLTRIPLLQDLSARERGLIAQYLAPQRYYPNEAIYRSGDSPTGLFIIERGAVRLLGDDDEEYSELTYGEAFGEMAVISAKPHSNTAQAANEVIVWRLSLDDFKALTETYPSIKTNLSRNLRTRLSGTDQAYAIGVLRRIPLFADLGREVLIDIARLLLLRHVPAGDTIFNQGDPGDAMYIVDSGSIQVISDARGKPGEIRTRFTEGDFFGETALLTGKTRTFTAHATTDSNLWCLYRTDFDNLLVKYPQISVALSQALRDRLTSAEDYTVEPHLQKIALLGGLSRSQLDELSARLEPRRYQGGSTVCYEGGSGEEMYFIERGQVELWATTAQGPILLESLEEGDYFGEIALLSGRPHLGTAYAVAESDIWALNKVDFDDFLRRSPNLGIILSRTLSQRMEETMNRLRGAPAQRSLPAPGITPVSRPARPYPSTPSRAVSPARPTGPMPPVPVRPVTSMGGGRPVTPMSRTVPPSAPVPPVRPASVHSQYTQPVSPVPPPSSRPGGPTIHSQHTQGIPPVGRQGQGDRTSVHSQHTQGIPPVGRQPGASALHSQHTQGMPRIPSSRPVQGRAGKSNRRSRQERSRPVGPQQRQGVSPSRPVPALPAPSTPPAAGIAARSMPQSTGQAEGPQPRSYSNRRLSRYNQSISVWFANRTLGAKLRLLAFCIAIVWLCGIMLPSLIINALASTFSDEGALPGDRRSPLQQMRDEGALGAMAMFPFVETATPIPTDTPTPTNTPTQTSTPTSTSIPTHTATPTMTPTPTETPTPIFTPTPTDTPTRVAIAAARAPTDTPEPPTPEPTPTPDVDFRVKSVRQLTPCENQSKHHIFIKVEDANGQGINGIPVKIQWSPVVDGSVIAQTETKTDLLGQTDVGRIDFAMFKGSYTIEVMGGTSEIAGPVTPDYGTNEACGENAVANSLYHISFEVIFQRTF